MSCTHPQIKSGCVLFPHPLNSPIRLKVFRLKVIKLKMSFSLQSKSFSVNMNLLW